MPDNSARGRSESILPMDGITHTYCDRIVASMPTSGDPLTNEPVAYAESAGFRHHHQQTNASVVGQTPSDGPTGADDSGEYAYAYGRTTDRNATSTR